MDENIKSIVYGGKGQKTKHMKMSEMTMPKVKDIEGGKMSFNEERAYTTLASDIKKKAKF